MSPSLATPTPQAPPTPLAPSHHWPRLLTRPRPRHWLCLIPDSAPLQSPPLLEPAPAIDSISLCPSSTSTIGPVSFLTPPTPLQAPPLHGPAPALGRVLTTGCLISGPTQASGTASAIGSDSPWIRPRFRPRPTPVIGSFWLLTPPSLQSLPYPHPARLRLVPPSSTPAPRPILWPAHASGHAHPRLHDWLCLAEAPPYHRLLLTPGPALAPVPAPIPFPPTSVGPAHASPLAPSFHRPCPQSSPRPP